MCWQRVSNPCRSCHYEYCKKAVGEGREFERIRRITGYLTGTLDGWNSAKRAEEKDRVKHPVNTDK